MLKRNERKDVIGEKQFDADYVDNAHMQRSFNERYLRKLVAQIQLKFPKRDQPLKLLDIGCGDGNTTQQLYQQLKAAGYQQIEIKGIDISDKQIAVANQQKPADLNDISFVLCDALAFDEQDAYDIVYSFFTFHWVDDKKALSQIIADALKTDGVLFYLTVTRLEEWLAIRQQLLQKLLQHPEWQQYFSDFELKPFAVFSDYATAFNHNFNSTECEAKETPLNYSRSEFKKFITSWLPEIRHLKAVA